MEGIDVEKLREYLVDYFGAAIGIFPAVTNDVDWAMTAPAEELIQVALNNDIDLSDFKVGFSR